MRPTPVWWPMPRRVEFARDDAGGAHLLEAEFRMGVDVAADLDQRRLDALGGVADRGGGIVGQTLGHDGRSLLGVARIMLPRAHGDKAMARSCPSGFDVRVAEVITLEQQQGWIGAR